MDPKTLWESALAELQINLSSANFNTWFKGKTTILSAKDKIIDIGCNTTYTKNWLEQRYYGQIKTVLDKITNTECQLIFTVAPIALEQIQPIKKGVAAPLFEQNETPAEEPALAKAGLRRDFIFETFAVSGSNQLAHAAAMAIAVNPGKAYNPFFIYGGVGVGKTHLMQAIGNEILQKDKKKKIIYCMGEEFTNEIINAIREKSTKQFKEKYRSVDAFLIDDIQFIAGKTTVQEEFFHTFNTLQRGGSQIVMTSDRPPGDIQKLEDRLRSRFEAGMIVDIGQPDFELRTAILLIKCKMLGLELPMDAAKMIAENVDSNRKMEGFLTRVIAESKLKNIPITSELVASILGLVNRQASVTKKAITSKEVLESVANHFNLKVSQIKSDRRNKEIVVPRQIVMYLLRKELKTPLMDIGRLLGGRDHTTIMHGEGKITKELSTNENLKKDVMLIKDKLYG
ncbi:MAG: chromosomal replication initiator protein DnaA [Patescibacteria group bacterium]|nr:chromosomal replication initiator protein DnaA [Patescibacteria group bacterium]